jgi:hypothetical protein
MTKGGLVAVVILSGLAALSSLFSAVYALIAWKDSRYCWVFILGFQFDDDDYYTNDDYYDYSCNEGAWAALGFSGFVLWTITTGCVLYFLTSGRFEKCASAASDKEQEVEVEMAAVVAHGVPAYDGPAVASLPYAETAIVPEKAEYSNV